MKNEQVSELYNELKDAFLTGNYTGENKIIETENVIFQISTLEDQKNSLNPNVSTIDLGECENILKKENNISKEQSLIVFKSDMKNKDLSSTVVQYEIYHPITKAKLNLDCCKDVKIVVNVPVNLDTDTISLYDSLCESGYNLFDSEDSFYNDICATYTSENGTDMTLEDRKKEMYNTSGNITMCQEGCKFDSYNKTTKKAKCNCDAQSENTQTDITKINFDKKDIGKNFLTTLTNSNFMVLKCYKLVKDFSDFFKNKGRIIMSIIFISFIILVFIYFFKDRKSIANFLQNIIKSKENLAIKENLEDTKRSRRKAKASAKKKKGRKRKRKRKIKTNIEKDQNNINIPPKKKKINTRKSKNSISPPNSFDKVTSNNCIQSNRELGTLSKINKNSGNININIIPISHLHYSKQGKKRKVIKKKSNKNDIKIYKTHKIKTFDEKFDLEKNNKIYSNLNDEEINTLEYELAIIYDKRTYFQYYWSLLKKKQLILFTFIPTNDYNLFSLKLSLFLLSFSLYFTVNAFFFSDDTMHKIHEDTGDSNIFYRIPQILYSSIVSSIINVILKLLSLSEKNILAIKRQNNVNIAINNSKQIQKCIAIKFIIFFLLSNLLLLFFWYYISCFCAVYTNTQLILIKDTLVSFILSMIYPFALNLLPGIFRIPALRSKDKNKKLLYQISGFIALI